MEIQSLNPFYMTHSHLFKTLGILSACVLAFACTKPKETELSLSSLAANFDAAGAAGVTINVTSNEAWTVSNSADWLTASPTSGNGNGSFTLTAQENKGIDSRSTTVIVTAKDKSATISVSQLGLTPKFLITGDVSQKHVGYEGGTATLEIKANVPWTVTVPEDVSWVTASPTSGEGDGNVTFTFAPNVLRQARVAPILFRETVGGSEKTVKFDQEMSPATRLTDSLALVSIFNASHPDKWPKPEVVWDLTKPMTEWKGVTLTDGRVTSLKFGSATTGVLTEAWTMPADLCDLEELTEFRVVKCALNGEIFPYVYKLSKLKILYLTNNKVTGSLSSEIGNLTGLTDIYIDQNEDITGTLPAALGNLKSLKNLNIAKTAIGGTIPEELGGCESMANFMAYSTNLASPVPDIFSKFPNLTVVQLYNNPNMTGPLPETFGKLNVTSKNLSLHLYGCNFEGNIPESYANLPAVCKQFRVQDNKLKGVVPAAVQAHANWSTWKPETYIFPQQEGFGLSDKNGSGGQDLGGSVDTDPWN